MRYRTLLLSFLLCVSSSALVRASDETRQIDIPAQPLAIALRQFAEQTGLQLAFEAALATGQMSPEVKGELSSREALERLLRGTGLRFDFLDSRTVAVSSATKISSAEIAVGGLHLAKISSLSGISGNSKAEINLEDAKDPSSNAKDVVSTKGIPEILVKGKRSLNADIERTVDDPQPYVILGRANIERSGAANLTEFLMTRLPMNATGASPMAADTGNGNVSGVNLRGLGAGQTLILIDGRRAARTTRGFDSGQTDMNGIPLEAIERIEVLPTTASAIYGGSATGGVINIIMRRDYVGTQAAVTYDNSFDSDSTVKRFDLSSGFNLFDGKTSVLLTGSYTESNPLLANERDFVQRARANILANNPGYNLPLGAGTNISSATGGNLAFDNGTPLNSFFTAAPVGYGGYASDNGAALVTNAGAYNLDLRNVLSVRNSGGSTGGSAEITGGGPPVKYFSGSVRHDFSERVKAFLEVSHSENNSRIGGPGVILPAAVPGGAPSNPFQQNINIAWSSQQRDSYLETKSGYDRYGAGLIFKLPGDWVSSADYTLSKSEWSFRNTTPFFGSGVTPFATAIANGSINVLRDFDAQGLNLSQYIVNDFSQRQSPLEVTTKNPAVRLSGPLGTLKAGRPQLSLLLERQDSKFGTSTVNGGNGLVRLFPERSQKVDSAYLEMRVPLLSSLNNIAWVDELELQLAGRWDKYESLNANVVSCVSPTVSGPSCTPPPSTFVRNAEEEFSPLVALRFRPNGSVTFRASYGTGFLPPDIGQLTAPTLFPAYNLSYAVDPRRGNTVVGLIDATYGGNPDLMPETSTTWSAGIILTPTWLEGFRMSVDYTKIEKEDNIISLSEQQILTDEASFAGRVTRGANLPGDPAGWAGPITALDASTLNAARTNVEAYDMQFDYTLRTTNRGTFWFFAMATWQTQLDLRTSVSAPIVDSLGWTTPGATTTPLDLRGNLGLEWSSSRWTLGWSTRYAASYYVSNPASPASAGNFLAQGDGGRVPSQVYHDAFAKYRFELSTKGKTEFFRSLLDGVQVQAGIRNVFNTKPPYDISSRYYYYSGLGDPRLATYYLTVRRNF